MSGNHPSLMPYRRQVNVFLSHSTGLYNKSGYHFALKRSWKGCQLSLRDH